VHKNEKCKERENERRKKMSKSISFLFVVEADHFDVKGQVTAGVCFRIEKD